MEGLDALFNPSSVAVVGASSSPGKVGHDIFVNILRGGYTGILYPVNPKAKSIASVRAYPDIHDIPDPVDLAIIILPPVHAETAIKQAIEKGVKAVVIVSAGFKEVGGEGLEIERRIVAMCRQARVRVVGPNCLGVINPNADVRLNASFSARMPSAGNISFISQSGALCTAVLDFAADKDFGFSKFVSIGNKADVDELDLLRYFHADPETEVIMLYIEELQRGPEFIEAVKEITGGDPMPGHRQPPPTPDRWQAAKRSTMPSLPRAASSAWIRSTNCSISESPLPIETRAPWARCGARCPWATEWPSSPMPVGQASWPRT